ncbi:protein sawadee homeodomain homolog 2 [Phtheirospermum japonicum]|uniref:Protein sawadee homeodomain homolog 2 n=1 Tax=Phtheirospermum japonicum TaxID=374723 RepID=A0A830D8Q4_9LAMI|nr:protein sawadee homeodomain homolog 2 [Phtheirospermum japonicum]
MADGGCKNSAENGVVELEAMRKGSFSWHPCSVSLCSRGLGLIVEYEDNHSEEVIAEKDEILTRIRVRSTPLQGNDCSSLRQGNRVLAARSSGVKGVFCDALVEKAVHVRHSKRIHCRCSFTVKWVHQALEEAKTVPASAIMKLSTKSIDIHPAISTFFGMLESPNGVDTSLCSKLVDNLNWEVDINVLLEKQIEEISNSTDVSLKKISKNFAFGLEVGLKGQSHGTPIDTSSKEPHVLIPLLNNLNGYNPSGNKHPTETKDETPPYSVSSIQEEFNGSKLPLNPLAARAALASLRSELSVQSNVEKGNGKSITDDIPLNVSAALGVKSSNFEGIVKTLFPISSAPQVVDFSDVSTRKGKKNKISKKKITQTSETRLTRSRIQKSNDEGLLGKDETSDKVDSEKVTFAKDAENHNYSRKRTRSAAREETKKNNVQPKPKVRKSDFSETNEVDLFKGDASTESKRAKTTPKTAEGGQGTKKKPDSLKNHETRSSPRLRFLPRTRSQTKA